MMSWYSAVYVILVSCKCVWAQTTADLLTMPCPNMCNGKGWCDKSDRACRCFDGYWGADCSLRTCPYGTAWADEPDMITETESGHNEAECSNRGICDTSIGECACDDGFEGGACERKSCGNACSGNGKCVSMKYLATLKDPGEGTVHTYENVWDSNKIYGCVCDDGFSGYDCSLRDCPSGDDPLTTDGQTEIQSLVCKATGGSIILGFRQFWTKDINYRASASTIKAALEALITVSTPGAASGISVTFSSSATTMCDEDGATTTYIEFLQDYGSLPLLQTITTNLEHSSDTPSLSVSRYRTGTKEDSPCSNRGICDTLTGSCGCSMTSSCTQDCFVTSDGFGRDGSRGDCGKAEETIDACPGEVECTEHGVCDPDTFACSCQDGYTGADCSLMTCPYGKSWFSMPSANDVAHDTTAECSDMGICNRDVGECDCALGFEGAACQYMSCPGDDDDCSGHGECLSMSLLAQASEDNGVLASRTYGSTPNDPLRWDFQTVRGCKCNDGYTHFDCSGRTCPYGADPLEKNKINEIQLINCDLESSTTGAITFTFREQSATVTAKTATVSELEVALESMDTIDDVKVYFGVADESDGNICSNDGTDVYVEFLRPTGDVPLIESDRSSIISISEFKPGTKSWLECSGRGICDRDTGLCSCTIGFGSSDTQGNAGSYADCGAVLPVIEDMLDFA